MKKPIVAIALGVVFGVIATLGVEGAIIYAKLSGVILESGTFSPVISNALYPVCATRLDDPAGSSVDVPSLSDLDKTSICACVGESVAATYLVGEKKSAFDLIWDALNDRGPLHRFNMDFDDMVNACKAELDSTKG